METQDRQTEKVNRNSALEPMTEKILGQHAIIGLIVGAISYVPIAWIIFLILDIFGVFNLDSSFVFDAVGYIVIGFFIPSLFISMLGGLIVGAIAYSKGHKYLGAVLGGLLGPIIIFAIIGLRTSF